jgi:hypothetical protein
MWAAAVLVRLPCSAAQPARCYRGFDVYVLMVLLVSALNSCTDKRAVCVATCLAKGECCLMLMLMVPPPPAAAAAGACGQGPADGC